MPKTAKTTLRVANNLRENAKQLPHQYSEGDQVLMKRESKSKYGHASYDGPFTVTKLNKNGMVRIQKGVVADTFTIRLIKPYNT